MVGSVVWGVGGGRNHPSISSIFWGQVEASTPSHLRFVGGCSWWDSLKKESQPGGTDSNSFAPLRRPALRVFSFFGYLLPLGLVASVVSSVMGLVGSVSGVIKGGQPQ